MSDRTLSLTYDELAERLGITPKSAKHLVWRKKWDRTKGNDGKARIQVPTCELPDRGTVQPAAQAPDRSNAQPPAEGTVGGVMQSPDQSPTQPPVPVDDSSERIAELLTELAGARVSLDGERARREELSRMREADLDAAETRRLGDLERAADQHATELQSVRQLLQDRIGDLEGDRDRWVAEVERLREQLAAPQPGFLARLFGRAA